MNMMDIARQATAIAEAIERDEKVRPSQVAKLANLVAELASAASSATDPRAFPS
jgi:hypothetical protein